MHGITAPDGANVPLLEIRNEDNSITTFALVKLADVDKGRLLGALHDLPISNFQIWHLSAAVETNAVAVFGLEPVRFSGLLAISLALSLMHRHVCIPHCFLMEGGASPGGLSWAPHDPFQPPQAPDRTPFDLSTGVVVRGLARRAYELMPRIHFAAQRFYSAGQQPYPLDAIFDYVSAVDGLLNASKEVLFAERAATILGHSLGDRAAWRARCSSLYHLRNAYAHSNGPQADVQVHRHFPGASLNEVATWAWQVARHVLAAVLRQPQLLDAPAHKELFAGRMLA